MDSLAFSHAPAASNNKKQLYAQQPKTSASTSPTAAAAATATAAKALPAYTETLYATNKQSQQNPETDSLLQEEEGGANKQQVLLPSPLKAVRTETSAEPPGKKLRKEIDLFLSALDI